ncbi:hypothetical protein KPZU09_40430 [Klebsiella pneumoniae]|uniref:Uncharacterized protein n=1 Tax=Klebsiella pneumoniae TaxID=573 RepID=A0A919HV42_KLEPN|nr:hypothetical protein KPZU09_40430 [Klebsiella pneumoniae]
MRAASSTLWETISRVSCCCSQTSATGDSISAQRRIERREGFIQQQHRLLAHQTAGQRRALPLTAGELAGQTFQQRINSHLSSYRRDLRLLLAAQFKAWVDPEADILSNGQMVKQVILLKQHRDRTLRRRRRVMRLAVNQQAAAGGRQKPGD